MSKPNITIPTEFATNGVKTDFTAAKILDGFDRINPDVLAGDNLNKFIDDTYKGLNGTLELFDGCVLYDSNISYNDTSIVFNIDLDNKVKIYRSLINNNLGNSLTDDTKWEEVQLGGNSRNVGEIVASTIPLTDAGLHLLDGAQLSGSGSYSAFVDYIADLYDNATKYSNVTKIGSLTDTNGVLSGFSSSNYAMTKPNQFTAAAESANSWEMVFKITYSSHTEYQNIWSQGGSYASKLMIIASGSLSLVINNSGTSTDVVNIIGSTTLTNGNTYYVKAEYTGTEYNLYISTDGDTYTLEATASVSTQITDRGTNTIGINIADGSNYKEFKGSIDLTESYINIDGERWWTGVQPSWATDEAQWQESLTNYGACGKFVYDSVNNTLRLPKITGIVEGTTDVTALGDLVEAGLPNITGSVDYAAYGYYNNNYDNQGAFKNSTKSTQTGNANQLQGGGDNNGTYRKNTLIFDASDDNAIYGNSTTVQPQTIKVLYYIVIATSVKTDIEVDIDEIATDLNGKADVDLSNVPTSKGILSESYVNGTSWYRVYSDGWCEQGSTVNVGANSQYNGTFLKTFKDTNICFYATDNESALIGNSYGFQQGCGVSSATAFYLRSAYDSTVKYSWYACGYIS